MIPDYQLSEGQLERLASHKYSMSGSSMLDPCVQMFWRWLVEYIPLWWAPNSLTLAALLSNALSVGLLILYSPDARASPPGYTYVVCAVGLFLYGTLDGLDGKQARRTNSSSPLGELFDHGCDSISMVLVVVSLSIMLQLGNNPELMLFVCCVAMFIFYASHWQAYCSGVVRFGWVDVTEGQMSIIFFFLVTAWVGTEIWAVEVGWLGLQYKHVPVLLTLTGSFYAALNYFSVILIHGGIGRNHSTVADTSVLSPLFPMTLLLLMGVTLWSKSTTRVFRDHIVLFVMSLGMCSAKITKKIVLAFMSRSRLEMLDPSFLGLGFLFINQYFNTFLNEYLVLWLCFIYTTADLIWYMYSVCTQISQHLNISCFSIPYPPPPSAPASTSPPCPGSSTHLDDSMTGVKSAALSDCVESSTDSSIYTRTDTVNGYENAKTGLKSTRYGNTGDRSEGEEERSDLAVRIRRHFSEKQQQQQ